MLGGRRWKDIAGRSYSALKGNGLPERVRELDQKNSPSRFRFRPPCRPTFGFRLRPPGWASTYSRSVLGANGTVEMSRGLFKACPNAEFAICKKFSFQHFPQLERPVCGQICGQAASAQPPAERTRRELPDLVDPVCGRGSADGGWSRRRKPRGEGGKPLLSQLDITMLIVHGPPSVLNRSEPLLLLEQSCFIW